MLLNRHADRRRWDKPARSLYTRMVAQSRLPAFYVRYRVPDRLEGRFDLLALHAGLVMRRLGQAESSYAENARDLAQVLVDLMCDDFDANLREAGVGDLSVGRKVKKLFEAFYGRLAAYDAALANDDNELAETLARNLYRFGGGESAGDMALYVREAVRCLDAATTVDLLAGALGFPDPGDES